MPRTQILPPHLVIDDPRHDFGKVTMGDPVRHAFVVRNTGELPLELESAVASCGCTGVTIQDPVVAPGGTAQISVDYDSHTQLGRDVQRVTVFSNDPASKTTVLEISVDIQPLLVGFTPTRVVLEAKPGAAEFVDAWVTGRLRDRVRLTLEKTPTPGAKFQVIHERVNGAVHDGVRASLAGSKVDSVEAMASFATGVKEVPTIQLGYSIRNQAEGTAGQASR